MARRAQALEMSAQASSLAPAFFMDLHEVRTTQYAASSLLQTVSRPAMERGRSVAASDRPVIGVTVRPDAYVGEMGSAPTEAEWRSRPEER